MPPSRKTHRFLTHGRNRDTKPVVAKQMTDANSLLTQDSQYALRKLHPRKRTEHLRNFLDVLAMLTSRHGEPVEVEIPAP